MPLKKFALLIIDMAQDQLYPAGKTILPKDWSGYKNILKLASLLPMENVFDSRLWMTENDHSSLFDVCDVGRAGTPGASLVSHLKDLKATFVKKLQYSSFYHSELERILKSQGVTDILISGINTDYCVFASSLDAFYCGFRVYLVEDCCASIINGSKGHKEGIHLFEKFLLSHGQVITTTEAVQILKS